MQHDQRGPVPPQPVRPALPVPPLRRRGKHIDRRQAILTKAVMEQGAGYNPVALAEETGLPVDAIRRFAAQTLVRENLVGLGIIHRNDAIRIGSEALAASLRIVGRQHDNIEPRSPPARYLTKVDLMGMRRMATRGAQPKRLVAPPQTPCSHCSGKADAQGGCTHQQMTRADETTGQGLPHA